MIEAAGSVAGVVVALGAAGWAADRALLWMEARGWVYWRRRRGLKALGVNWMLEASPAARGLKQAMHDERARKNVRPAKAPPLDVDLGSGTIRIRLHARADEDRDTGADGKEATRA
jgi:hypothetical protein